MQGSNRCLDKERLPGSRAAGYDADGSSEHLLDGYALVASQLLAFGISVFQQETVKHMRRTCHRLLCLAEYFHARCRTYFRMIKRRNVNIFSPAHTVGMYHSTFLQPVECFCDIGLGYGAVGCLSVWVGIPQQGRDLLTQLFPGYK